MASVSKCTTWALACTPASVRPAHTHSTGTSATRDNARCTTSWMVCNPGWNCQPEYARPSYSRPTANRATPRTPERSAGQRLYQALRFLLLRSGAFRQNFVEDVARPVRIAHVDVRAREVELGSDFRECHGLE